MTHITTLNPNYSKPSEMFTQLNFNPKKIFNSWQEVQSTMAQYTNLSHYFVKECKDRRQHLRMITYRCSQNNVSLGGKGGCKFNVKFYTQGKSSDWSVHEKMNLEHNHDPASDTEYENRSKNKLSNAEELRLNLLLWQELGGAKKGVKQILKIMEGEFPGHGNFNLKKIKNVQYKLKKNLKSKLSHNKFFDIYLYIGQLAKQYESSMKKVVEPLVLHLEETVENIEDEQNNINILNQVSPKYTSFDPEKFDDLANEFFVPNTS